jgi:hypothetical protein
MMLIHIRPGKSSSDVIYPDILQIKGLTRSKKEAK